MGLAPRATGFCPGEACGRGRGEVAGVEARFNELTLVFDAFSGVAFGECLGEASGDDFGEILAVHWG